MKRFGFLALALTAVFYFTTPDHAGHHHPVTHSTYCKQWGYLYRDVPEGLSYCP